MKVQIMDKNVKFEDHPYNSIERIASLMEKCCHGGGDGDGGDDEDLTAKVGTAIVGKNVTG